MNLQQKLDSIGNFMIKVSGILDVLETDYPNLDWSKSYISHAECVYLVGISKDTSFENYQANIDKTKVEFEKIKASFQSNRCIDEVDYDGGFRITLECRLS